MTLRLLPTLALTLAMTAVTGSSFALARLAQPITPGYWESTSTSTFIVTSKPKTERHCITPDKVNEYLNSPSTSHYKCNYTHKVVEGGKAEFVGQCFDKHHRSFDITINGTYAPDAFRMAARFSPTGFPIAGSATTTAHRIGECPA